MKIPFFRHAALGLLMLAGVLLVSGPALAQVLYGSLTGHVTDPSGAVVPGATVEALNVLTGTARQETTNESGIYLFSLLQPGVYKVTISASGFSPTVTENISVNANSLRRNDVQLKIGR